MTADLDLDIDSCGRAGQPSGVVHSASAHGRCGAAAEGATGRRSGQAGVLTSSG